MISSPRSLPKCCWRCLTQVKHAGCVPNGLTAASPRSQGCRVRCALSIALIEKSQGQEISCSVDYFSFLSMLSEHLTSITVPIPCGGCLALRDWHGTKPVRYPRAVSDPQVLPPAPGTSPGRGWLCWDTSVVGHPFHVPLLSHCGSLQQPQQPSPSCWILETQAWQLGTAEWEHAGLGA